MALQEVTSQSERWHVCTGTNQEIADHLDTFDPAKIGFLQIVPSTTSTGVATFATIIIFLRS